MHKVRWLKAVKFQTWFSEFSLSTQHCHMCTDPHTYYYDTNELESSLYQWLIWHVTLRGWQNRSSSEGSWGGPTKGWWAIAHSLSNKRFHLADTLQQTHGRWQTHSAEAGTVKAYQRWHPTKGWQAITHFPFKHAATDPWEEMTDTLGGGVTLLGLVQAGSVTSVASYERVTHFSFQTSVSNLNTLQQTHGTRWRWRTHLVEE